MPKDMTQTGLGTHTFGVATTGSTGGWVNLGGAYSNFSMTVIWSGSSTGAKAARLQGQNTTAGAGQSLILNTSSGTNLAKSTAGYACDYIRLWSTALGSTENPWTFTAHVSGA